MIEEVTCQRTYKIKLYPNRGKSEHMRYTAMRFTEMTNYFIGREYFGLRVRSTCGTGLIGNLAKYKAGCIVRAIKAKSEKSNVPVLKKNIFTSEIVKSRASGFDFSVLCRSQWVKGMRAPAKSHTALNKALRNGWAMSGQCEPFLEGNQWFCRVFVSKKVKIAEPRKAFLGVDVGIAHASTRSDKYLGKNLKPIMDKATEKQKQRNKNKYIKSVTTAKKTSVKQVLDAEVNSCIRRSKKLGANVVIESPKALANLKSGKMSRWARCYFANRLHVRAREESVNIIEIWPAGTSITCHKCGHRDKQSRKSQSVFNCTACGNVVNADYNAALNIAEKGRVSLCK